MQRMRSGVIAQKVGMTRLFTESGEHIPVTVLKLDNVQVIAHLTQEKNGYTALQLGAGKRKPNRLTKAEREVSAAEPLPRAPAHNSHAADRELAEEDRKTTDEQAEYTARAEARAAEFAACGGQVLGGRRVFSGSPEEHGLRAARPEVQTRRSH